jgi:hypothetical protein
MGWTPWESLLTGAILSISGAVSRRSNNGTRFMAANSRRFFSWLFLFVLSEAVPLV